MTPQRLRELNSTVWSQQNAPAGPPTENQPKKVASFNVGGHLRRRGGAQAVGEDRGRPPTAPENCASLLRSSSRRSPSLPPIHTYPHPEDCGSASGPAIPHPYTSCRSWVQPPREERGKDSFFGHGVTRPTLFTLLRGRRNRGRMDAMLANLARLIELSVTQNMEAAP